MVQILFLIYFGGDKGIRTPDLLTASQARSQLRHTPTCIKFIHQLFNYSKFTHYFSSTIFLPFSWICTTTYG